jgi:hypothetical protein
MREIKEFDVEGGVVECHQKYLSDKDVLVVK